MSKVKKSSRLKLAINSIVLVLIIWLPTVVIIQVNLLKTGYYVATKEGVDRYMKRPKSWTNLANISKVTQHAIVVSEDWMFYQHAGIDYHQLTLALEEYMKKGKRPRGASTITQQLAKNMFTSGGRSLWRKGIELIYTFAIEVFIEKPRILELYFNIIELGEGIYGVGRGAEYYFKKNPKSLGAREGAFLAMLLPNPKKYNASFKQKYLTRYARKTIFNILRKLQMAGVISTNTLLREASTPFPWER